MVEKEGTVNINFASTNKVQRTGPIPQDDVLIQLTMTVESSHDHGDWRYVKIKGNQVCEEATLRVPRDIFDKLSTVGTKVMLTVKKLP